MITNEQKKLILKNMIEQLDLPNSAYEKATTRYKDLGQWFDRDSSALKDNRPHIFPQGSFRLGTAIRPLNETEEYDLDLVCKLRTGITKDTYSQEALKRLVGKELEAYRTARGIQEKLTPKHRCWRLEYHDDLSFHMDIVPCIPAGEKQRQTIEASMRRFGLEESLSGTASRTTVSITDDRHADYSVVCGDWNISNPEGYALWFEYRMNPSRRKILLAKAQVDEVPLFQRKTPLQRAIQLLKRHRDQRFKDNEEVKPISIIITTLAARAYNGEDTIVTALHSILTNMGALVNPQKPRVPNPVDPEEDFADRWYREDCQHLQLERNFFNWLKQAQSDFDHIVSTTDTQFILEQAKQKFSITLNRSELSRQLGVGTASVEIITPKRHEIIEPPRPWINIG